MCVRRYRYVRGRIQSVEYSLRRRAYVCEFLCMCFLCMCFFMYVCFYVCICPFMCVCFMCVYICLFICVFVCVFLCVCFLCEYLTSLTGTRKAIPVSLPLRAGITCHVQGTRDKG